ncbi:uncharacterized protein LOC109807395 [Cajanus cajan]|uniref:mTERF domain-containing protein 1, mitochondrial n=1 Tax=Cajanus cajan TaxID=3821 RepID=A0A151STJ2_CAJCA|nr:uncharacterized protein LOC109807395 [Cajanus cajan]KYP58078.1 hypothetical protein KK1_004369 [Cajanus cajan]
MLKLHAHRTIVCAKAFTFTTLKRFPIVQHQIFKFDFCTTTSHPHSFAVSYLVNNCGFSLENALKASPKLRFRDPQKPDSVFCFFRSHGFSDSQICIILQKELQFLSCKPQKVLLPKFEFLRSKGASSLDIVRMVTANPSFLKRSLENHIIPAYEFVRGIIQSDKQIIDFLIQNSYFLFDPRVAPNVKLLLDFGVTHSQIHILLKRRPLVLCSSKLLETVQELKQMGFDVSKSTFCIALLAKRTVNKAKWEEKVDTFKKWGWSQEQILVAFRSQPYIMLSSLDKINAVFSFWVEQAGFKSLDLVRAPGIFLLSLQKRIAPRASVLQFLTSKGLLQKDASLSRPFILTEKLFLEKYVIRFKGVSSHLLKLYEDKMSLENDRNNTCT